MNHTAANTTVMILAAGRGERMRGLTENTPKPLLKVGGISLIERHLMRLSEQGFRNVVINIAYYAEQIREKLSDGQRFGLTIKYSDESDVGALETAGGIINALPLIDSDPFIVINADIVTDYSFSELLKQSAENAKLVMVNNPQHNPTGDFVLDEKTGLLSANGTPNRVSKSFTFSGIALYRKSTFANLPIGKQALAPIFHQLIKQQLLLGEHYTGQWFDIGTPERLVEINQILA